MRRPSISQFLHYAARYRGWQRYLLSPADGRIFPQIDAPILLNALLVSKLLREVSFLAVEAMAHSPVRRAMGIRRSFGDDTLSYFIERLDVDCLRNAVTEVIRQAKRNKSFSGSQQIGLAIDGTGVGHSRDKKCDWCRPRRNKKKEIVGYGHNVVMTSVVGTELTLPMDMEPYGPGDSEYAAGMRLLQRTARGLGSRFADYVVADGEFATAPFLHLARDLGLKSIARLKGNLPELFEAAKERFASLPAEHCFRHGMDWVEMWDADDFDPWYNLRWETVRVFFYRQYKKDGSIVEAYWLTDFSKKQADSKAIFKMAKSRWEIENQGFNDAKNRYGFEHICHHHQNSLLVNWLITALAITLERLFRYRYLHRGNHQTLTSIALLRLLRLNLIITFNSS